MNKKVVYIASGAMIIISIVIVVLLIRMRNNQSVVDDDKLRDESPSPSSATSVFPLTYNPSKKVDKVKELQEKLNTQLAYYFWSTFPVDSNGNQIKKLKTDGYFGKNTLSVVKWRFNKSEVTEDMFNSI